MSLDDDARAELAELEAAHRLRVPRVVGSVQGPRVVLDGVEVVSFASNDYLSLAGDPRLARAAANALEESGTGVGASRLIVGNHQQHVALEAELADWLQAGGVRLFGSGYAANVGVLTTLLRPGDVVFSDELNHASIIDGCRLARAEVVVFPHLDMAALERELATRASSRRRLVVSETLFSMDGDVADVEALLRIAKRADAAVMLDEAHAIGVWGPEGRGTVAAFCADGVGSGGLAPDIVVGTCGKALGSAGAFVASSRAVSELLWTRARSFVFSTGLPPAVSAATRAALEVVRGSDGLARRRGLRSSVGRLRQLVPALGGHPDSAIAPLVVGDDRRVMEMTAQLLEQRVFVQGIRPPTVPEGRARLRVSLAAGHGAGDVERLGQLLRRFT